MNFGQLQDEVETNVIDLPTAVQTNVPSYINRAIRALESLYNFPVMKATSDFTTTEGTATLGAIPSNFIGFRGKPYLTEYQGRVRKLAMASSVREAQIAFGTSITTDIGEPRVILSGDLDTTGTGSLLIYPIPDGLSDYSDGDYRVSLPYWRTLSDLSADSDTNWFTVNADQFIIDRATAFAFMTNWDEDRAVFWQSQAANEAKRLIREQKIALVSGLETFVPHLGALEPQTEIE